VTRGEVERTVTDYEAWYRVPCCDPLWHGAGKVADAIIKRFLGTK